MGIPWSEETDSVIVDGDVLPGVVETVKVTITRDDR